MRDSDVEVYAVRGELDALLDLGQPPVYLDARYREGCFDLTLRCGQIQDNYTTLTVYSQDFSGLRSHFTTKIFHVKLNSFTRWQRYGRKMALLKGWLNKGTGRRNATRTASIAKRTSLRSPLSVDLLH
ncbi:hypothetical protein EVAR_5998_1 [Eumeta japonica]|uniref:Uncharacterized protein n=1 Tax=Eumeta variegata TaxID=151549 RepID=A0A4C1TAK6_EUMVA|nr:hypothetical protein EVAR_5998_1 [Eumeta japonica]